MAKLRSNFAGTVFHLYTPGLNPKDKKATLDKIREELAVILYEANFMGANGPRKMQILLPTLD